MVANTILEVYTLIFAWNMYGAIWDVLTGSGIALIPFIAALLNNFIENYKDGDAKTTIKDLELKGIGMILVLMLCVIPFRGFSTSLSTIQYDLATPDCNPPANTQGTGNNTSTAYDTSFPGLGMDVYKPVAWSFVEFLSSAITHTTIKSMSCVNNYEFMLLRISQISIQSQDLQQRVRDFHSDCYLKALNRYKINPTPLATNISELDDIDWLGSGVLLTTVDEYYRHGEAYMSNMEQYGFTRQTTFRKSDKAKTSGAHPYCNEVWSGETGAGVSNPAPGLRQLILNDIPLDEAGNILDAWKNWGSQVLTVGTVTDTIKEDMLLKLILQADAANLNAQSNVNLSNNLDVNKGWSDYFFAAIGIAKSADELLQAKTMSQMLKVAGPMIIALIQMIIIMGAPFVLVLGRYQLSAFIAIALAYFAFEFINAIWAAMYWFDNRILDLFMSQAGWVDKLTNSTLVYAISAAGMILLPTIWLSILAYSGAGMVRSMGMGGIGGGVASGSGAFNRAGSRTVGLAYNRHQSRKNK